MSLKALTWAFEQEVFPSTKKFVLIAMANFCGETGLSYPSLRTVCEITALRKEETVSEYLAELVGEGRLEDTGDRIGETGRTKVYRFPEAARQIPRGTGDFKNGKSPANPPRIPRLAESPNIKEPGTIKERASALDVALPASLDVPEFRAAWSEWLDDRKERKKSVSAKAARKQLKDCEAWGVAKSIVAIDTAIKNQWQGLFEPKNYEYGKGNRGSRGQIYNAGVGTLNEGGAAQYAGVGTVV